MIFAEYAVVSSRWMISSNPAGAREFIAKVLNGLILPCAAGEAPSGEKVGDLGRSLAPVGYALSDGGDLIRMDSMLTGIKVSRAAFGWLLGACGASPLVASGERADALGGLRQLFPFMGEACGGVGGGCGADVASSSTPGVPSCNDPL